MEFQKQEKLPDIKMDNIINLLQSYVKLKFRDRMNISEINMTNDITTIGVDQNNTQIIIRSKRVLPLLIPLLGIGIGLAGIGFSIGQVIQSAFSDKKIEKKFEKVFVGIGKNYDAINKNYKAINNVENKVDRNFVLINLVYDKVSEILSVAEKTRIEMHQEFTRVLESIKNARIEPVVSKLNNIIQYFAEEVERIRNLAPNEYIDTLLEPNGILLDLKESRKPKVDSLHTYLYDIIDQSYAIPKDANDELAFTALYALYYGTQTYVSIMFFLLEQYLYLANYCYQNRDIEGYNKYFGSVQTHFQGFKHSLIGSSSSNDKSLIENVIEILTTVQSKDFMRDAREDLFKLLTERIESLTVIKQEIEKIILPIIIDVPRKLTGKPTFEKLGINTPVGEWKDGAKVSYAIQYRNNDTYSKVGEWSEPLTVSGEANPFIKIAVDPKRRTRLIFRKFNDDKPQLVGTLENKYQTKFRDINRDLYNAASMFNEAIAINIVDTLMRNGADSNAVFDNGRGVIHAAAQGGNTKLAQHILINNNSTDINAKDNNGYTSMHIAAEAGHNDFIKSLVDYGADVNARTYADELSPLHIAAYKGYVSTVETLIQSDAIDTNARDKEGFTPLHSAVFGGIPVIEALILNNSTDVNAKSEVGLTPLHLSSINNYVDIAEALLSSDNIDINARAQGNFTALHFAAMVGNLEMVKFLTVQNETDINAESISDWTPLHFAISLRKEDVVLELLILNNTNVNAIGEGDITALHISAITGQKDVVLDLLVKEAMIEQQTKDGLTALHFAAVHGNQEVVATLIDNGAYIEVKTIEGSTPLLSAASSKNSNVDTIKYLIENGADLNATTFNDKTCTQLAVQSGSLDAVRFFVENNNDPSVIGDNDKSLLFFAINIGNLDVVRYFIEEKQVDINIKSEAEISLLHLAVEVGNLHVVKYLIAKGADVNSIGLHNKTPLHFAVEYRNLDAVKYLIEKGADVNARESYNRTPLDLATESGRLDVVKYLIEKKSNVNARNNYGRVPLHSAVEKENLDIVKYLIQKGANVNAKDIHNGTPLHIATTNGQLDIVKYLIEKGANVNAANYGGRVPLHFAIGRGNMDAVKYLIDKGADVNANKERRDTPLHFAAIKGSLDALKYLIEKGADVNGSFEYATPLTRAIFSERLDVVKLLIEKGAAFYTRTNSSLHSAALIGNLDIVKYIVANGVDVNVRDEYGDFPLYFAAESGNLDVVKYLIAKGADINAVNKDSRSSLYMAVYYGKLDVVKYFIAEGLNVNSKDRAGITPLHMATIKRGNLDIVKYLIEKGANVNARDRDLCVPLHYAALHGELGEVKYLIEKGADVYAKDKSGVTVLHFAAKSGNLDKVKFLVEEKRTDINNNGNYYGTPLHYATTYSHLPVVKYLSEKGANLNARDKENKTPLELAHQYNISEVYTFLKEEEIRRKSYGIQKSRWRRNYRSITPYLSFGHRANPKSEKINSVLMNALLVRSKCLIPQQYDYYHKLQQFLRDKGVKTWAWLIVTESLKYRDGSKFILLKVLDQFFNITNSKTYVADDMKQLGHSDAVQTLEGFIVYPKVELKEKIYLNPHELKHSHRSAIKEVTSIFAKPEYLDKTNELYKDSAKGFDYFKTKDILIGSSNEQKLRRTYHQVQENENSNGDYSENITNTTLKTSRSISDIGSWVKYTIWETFVWMKDSVGELFDSKVFLHGKPENSKVQSLPNVSENYEPSNGSTASSFVSVENAALIMCVADVLDNTRSKRYQTLTNQGVNFVPSIQTAVNFARRKFDSFVEREIRDLDLMAQARIRVAVGEAYPEIMESFRRGVEFSGNVGLDDVLDKCKECFCKNILPTNNTIICIHDIETINSDDFNKAK